MVINPIIVTSHENQGIPIHQQFDCLYKSMFIPRTNRFKHPYHWPIVKGMVSSGIFSSSDFENHFNDVKSSLVTWYTSLKLPDDVIVRGFYCSITDFGQSLSVIFAVRILQSVTPLNSGNRHVISSHNLLVLWLTIHAWILVNPMLVKWTPGLFLAFSIVVLYAS